jgi:hypothetical protein
MVAAMTAVHEKVRQRHAASNSHGRSGECGRGFSDEKEPSDDRERGDRHSPGNSIFVVVLALLGHGSPCKERRIYLPGRKPLAHCPSYLAPAAPGATVGFASAALGVA